MPAVARHREHYTLMSELHQRRQEGRDGLAPVPDDRCVQRERRRNPREHRDGRRSLPRPREGDLLLSAQVPRPVRGRLLRHLHPEDRPDLVLPGRRDQDRRRDLGRRCARAGVKWGTEVPHSIFLSAGAIDAPVNNLSSDRDM